MKTVSVIGAGLAGSEAAWQLAKRGIKVKLYEQRPVKSSPVHHTDLCAELVCSNSLRADGLANAVGLIKEEMRRMDSLIMRCADATRLPAGAALAVDREGFSRMVTEELKKNPDIEFIHQEVTELPEGPVIIASGPLTDGALAETIANLTGGDSLHFHDAVAPIVNVDTLDMNIVYRASRWGKGDTEEGDYLNCPMDREQYDAFYQALTTADLAPLHEFEEEKDFDGCMAIEAMARRGYDTMRYGPMKPVGLVDPRTGEEAYAVVQLRQDNAAATMYNIVGFQTRLKWGEQKRVFSMIPGLENAEFVRYGVMHRNTYINSPNLLNFDLSLKEHPDVFFAGQITGVEGYVESAACGLVAGLSAAAKVLDLPFEAFPKSTATGGLMNYIMTPNADFQPMNVTFGLIEHPHFRIRKKSERNQAVSENALNDLAEYMKDNKLF